MMRPMLLLVATTVATVATVLDITVATSVYWLACYLLWLSPEKTAYKPNLNTQLIC
jgi:uncharacterized membrane protein